MVRFPNNTFYNQKLLHFLNIFASFPLLNLDLWPQVKNTFFEVHIFDLHNQLMAQLPLLQVSFLPVQLQKDRKSTRLNSSHVRISYAVFCLKKKKKYTNKNKT